MRTRPSLPLFSSTIAAALAMGAPAVAQAADAPAEAPDIITALTEGTPSLEARYRIESVDVDALEKDSFASTVRLALGYTTGTYKGFSANVEFETTQVIGNYDAYHQPANPQPGRPPIADPEHVEVNHAWLQYKHEVGFTGKLGRQTIIHDGARFVGNVGWRQNEQTFDALRLMYGFKDIPLKLEYSYVWNVNRIFSDNSGAPPTAGLTGDDVMASHLLHGSYKVDGWGTLSGFAYLLDYEYRDGLDTTTVGLRFAGARKINDDLKAVYEVSLASQGDSGDNDADISEMYTHVMAGLSYKWITAKLGYELLGGDTGTAFQTPLATLHKFNGWADLFLGTPAGGLQDIYFGVNGTAPAVPGLKWGLFYHTYENDTTGADLGDEINLVVTYPLKKIAKGLAIGAKAASYSAGDAGSDVDKIWLWTQYKF